MSSIHNRILRSPLLHFALVGALLFVLVRHLALPGGDGASDGSTGGSGATERGADGPASGAAALPSGGGGPSDPSTIRVGRDALLAFIQSRTRMARVEEAAQALDSATPAVRQDWIDRYVREEALVREARALGLDSADELVRRRLVQQMEFLVEGIDEAPSEISQAELEIAYRRRAYEFNDPETVRFAHVFAVEVKEFEKKSLSRARNFVDLLNRDAIGFDQAFPYGDPFLYDRTYVDRTREEIVSHFGEEFTAAIWELEPTPNRWRGPFRSKHGFHIVLLTQHTPARHVPFAEVADQLREEILRNRRERALEKGVAAIMAKYRVELERGLEGGSAGGQAGGPAGATAAPNAP
jgi:PPIC-type PPIASE domain